VRAAVRTSSTCERAARADPATRTHPLCVRTTTASVAWGGGERRRGGVDQRTAVKALKWARCEWPSALFEWRDKESPLWAAWRGYRARTLPCRHSSADCCVMHTYRTVCCSSSACTRGPPLACTANNNNNNPWSANPVARPHLRHRLGLLLHLHRRTRLRAGRASCMGFSPDYSLPPRVPVWGQTGRFLYWWEAHLYWGFWPI
jgi:hypothetical protein